MLVAGSLYDEESDPGKRHGDERRVAINEGPRMPMENMSMSCPDSGALSTRYDLPMYCVPGFPLLILRKAVAS